MEDMTAERSTEGWDTGAIVCCLDSSSRVDRRLIREVRELESAANWSAIGLAVRVVKTNGGL